MNSFKDLLDDDEPIPENIFRNVEKKVNGTVDRVRFVGNTSDLYLDKIGRTFVAFLGGGKSSSSHNKPSVRNIKENGIPPGGSH